MTISYDLRYATDHFPGVGTHAFELLRAVLALEGNERYRVLWNPSLSNRRFRLDSVRMHSRVEWMETGAPPLGLAGIRETGSLLRAHPADLHFSPFYLRPWPSAGPVVLTLHDVLPLTTPSLFSRSARLGFRVAMRLARGADGIVTSSEYARAEILRTTGIAPRRVHRIPPGCPEPPEERPLRSSRAPAREYALVVGINKPHKNLETLVAAWSRLGPRPPLELVSVGPRDDRYPDLSELAARFGAHGVQALGAVDAGELEALYSHATLVLFPSLHEGFGFPLAEALARGIPAVVSDIPTLREMGEGAACFVPAQDVAAWEQAVRDLAEDPAARAALATAARARAAAFSYRRCAEAMLDLWRRSMP